MSQKLFSFFSSAICFAVIPHLAYSLPEDPKVIAGSAEIKHLDPHTMQIKARDRTILNYSKFGIGKGEKVKFIQESPSSSVLNKVTSKDPSKILGSLESNGKVFLVNPNGVYFGPESQVNVGSLIVSTLHMADEDFLQGKYEFHLADQIASIQNEGSLIASDSIAFISPQIQNKGLIQAKAAVFAAGKHVALDFTGDGLMQFSVEGSLKEALIEHLGKIQSSNVTMKIPAAKKAISEIVNIDGAEIGDVFTEENGIIKLASLSSIKSDKVILEGAHLEVEGTIDSTSSWSKGGKVHLLGTHIDLTNATIDVSGIRGGGEVLVGGEFQGKGKTPYASTVAMDESSQILANSLENGDGGLVVLWSQNRTIFDGKVEAKGGFLGGNGGTVESSSQGRLKVSLAQVDTLAPRGKTGEWLLDPSTLIVGTDTDVCLCSETLSQDTTAFGDCAHVSPCSSIEQCLVLASAIEGSHSNVTLQATSFVIFSVANLTMQYPNIGISVIGNCNSGCPNLPSTDQPCTLAMVGVFPDQASSGSPFFPPIPGPVTFTTQGGDFSIATIGTIVVNPWTIDTTGGGVYPGGNVNLLGVFTDPNISLDPAGVTIKAGSGIVTASTQKSGWIDDGLPAYTFVDYFTVESASQVNSYSLKTKGDASNEGTIINAPLYITAPNAMEISTEGAPISLSSVNFGDGLTAYPLVISAEGNSITLGNVGDTNPPTTFTVPSGPLYCGSIKTSGGNINIGSSSITIIQDAEINANGGTITLASGINPNDNGVQSLTVNAGANSLSLAVGNFKNLTLIASTITPPGPIQVTGALTLTSSTALNLTNGDITCGSFIENGGGAVTLNSDVTAGSGALSFADEITLSDNVSLTASSNLTLSSGVIGAGFSLTLTGNSITTAQLGTSSSPLSTISFSAPKTSSFKDVYVSSRADFGAPIGLTESLSTIEVIGGGSSSNFIRFQSTVNGREVGAQGLEIIAGNNYVVFQNSLGSTTALGPVTVTASSSQISGIKTSGAPIEITGPASLYYTLSSATLDTTNDGQSSGAGISFSSSLSGSFSQSLNMKAGSAGAITFSSDIGPFGALDIPSAVSVGIKNILSNSINIAPHTILSISGFTTLTSNSGGPISLGAIDGTASGSQSLSIVTTGPTFLGAVGESIYLNQVQALNSSSVTLQNISTNGNISITSPVTLSASTTLNSALASPNGDISLNSVNATSSGSQSLSITAGSKTVTFTGDIGALIPPGNLSIQGSSISFQGTKVYAAGTHTYESPVLINQSIAFRSLGNILFESTINPATVNTPSLILYPGGGNLTFMSSIGSSPLGTVAVYNAGSFSAEAISAQNLVVGGGLPTIFLNGEINLSGFGGIHVDGGPLYLGDEINTKQVWLRTRGNILNIDTPSAINVSEGINFSEYLNAIQGNIGSISSPIEINTDSNLSVGAAERADFIGTPNHTSVRTITSNRPCIVTFNGITILDCTQNPFTPSNQSVNIFNLLPKTLFYVPGIFSSWGWDSLSGNWYFQQEPFYLGENYKDRTQLHYLWEDRSILPEAENTEEMILVSTEKEEAPEENLLSIPVEKETLPEIILSHVETLPEEKIEEKETLITVQEKEEEETPISFVFEEIPMSEVPVPKKPLYTPIADQNSLEIKLINEPQEESVSFKIDMKTSQEHLPIELGDSFLTPNSY